MLGTYLDTRRDVLGTLGAVLVGGWDDLRGALSGGDTSLPGGDWPTVGGGPRHAGVAFDASVEGSLTPRWEAPLADWPHASPVVADGAVVVADADRVRALDATDGTVRWGASLVGGPTGTPAVDAAGKRVLAPTRTADGAVLAALDLETGDRRWRTRVAPGAAHAVTVADGMAVLRTRQGAVAVSVTDGRVRWRRDDLGRLRSLDHGSPGFEADSTLARTSTVTAAVADHTVYVPGRDELLALDARDGSVRWRVPVAGVAATPAVADGTVVAAGGTELVAVALDGTVRWRSPAGGRRGSPAVADGVVYAPGDGLVALDLADGTERWVRPPAATPSPDCAVLGDTVVVHDDGLSGVARRPDRDGLLAGYRRWQSDVQTAGYSPVAVGAERLVAVEPFDGRVVAFG